MPILQVTDLKVYFPGRQAGPFGPAAEVIRAVDGVSLKVEKGGVLGLVGESGCGKTTLARAIVRLAPVTSGRVLFDGMDLTGMSGKKMRPIRTRLQMVFQDPYASLNPRRTVFDTLAEPLRVHGLAGKRDIPRVVGDLMERVGLPPRFMRKYPHEFSGGQRQRIAIARALAVSPDLIVADEPVSALDVSVQAQILNLLNTLCKESRLTMLLVSHDLAVVRYLASHIAVMYLGHLVETGPADTLLASPAHPYTQALLAAVPVPDPDVQTVRLSGAAANTTALGGNPPTGCPYCPRCSQAIADCQVTKPQLHEISKAHRVACLNPLTRDQDPFPG